MIISEHWLREWIDLDVDTTELVRILNMGGLEVDAVHPAGPQLDNVIVGRIVSVENHPDSDRLRLCQVDTGGNHPVGIVCGAPNARAGLFAPLALPGAELPGDRLVELATIRGIDSLGMLCSARELDLGDEADGLLELDDNARPGQSLHDCLSLGDSIIEIELTANRGDCLSMLGVARELSVLTGSALNHPVLPIIEPESDAGIPITLDSPERCPRYVGRVIDRIDAKARTPSWMSERLRRCGVRPVSPVVDVTNYVMLEIGQPMHAFDKDRLSAISVDSKSIVLEAAFFAPQAISGHARRYALHTDASHRFERGVDPELPRIAANYATALLQKITGGTPGPVIEAVDSRFLPDPKPVAVRHQRVNRLIGVDIPRQDIEAILSRVGSQITDSATGWHVEPPSYRFDIKIECDLIEEIARVRGYDRLPASVPTIRLDRIDASDTNVASDRVKSVLVDRDYREVITYSFVDPILQHRLSPEEQEIDLKNPLASNLSVMRSSLWPGLLQVMIDNINRQHRRIRLFEVGKTFHGTVGEIAEKERISGVVTGTVWPEQWGCRERGMDFFDVKSDLEALFALTQLSDRFSFQRTEHHPGLHPGQAAVIRKDSSEIGYLGRLHPGYLGRLHPEHQRALELPQPVYLFEIELSALTRQKMPEYAGISRFPAIRRDLAVWVDEAVSAGELLDLISTTSGEYLINLELFDVYRREDIDSKRKSMAFSLTLQASSRTLTDSDVESIIDRTLRELHDHYGAELRT